MKSLLITLFFTTCLFASFRIEKDELFLLDSNESFSIFADLYIVKDATLQAGDTSNIFINKNWINDGIFKSATSKVNFVGKESSTILGETVFYDFISKKDTIFESDNIQKIQHKLVLNDAIISSTVSGIQAIMDLSTVQTIDTNNLNIKDNKIIGRAVAINPVSSIDSGNNIGWFSRQHNCQDIGSSEWLDKLLCSDDSEDKPYIKYLIEDNTFSASLKFNEVLKEDIDISVYKQEKITFIYTHSDQINKRCVMKTRVELNNDGSILSAYKSDEPCSYTDTTLLNGEIFKDNTLIEIRDTSKKEREIHKDAQIVIILDINLSSSIIIGGNDEK